MQHLLFIETSEEKDLQSFAPKLTTKIFNPIIPASTNNLIYRKKQNMVKQSRIITQQPKFIEN